MSGPYCTHSSIDSLPSKTTETFCNLFQATLSSGVLSFLHSHPHPDTNIPIEHLRSCPLPLPLGKNPFIVFSPALFLTKRRFTAQSSCHTVPLTATMVLLRSTESCKSHDNHTNHTESHRSYGITLIKHASSSGSFAVHC